MKIKYSILALLLTAGAVNAQTSIPESWHAHSLGEALGYSTLFGALGIVLMIIGFKVFDKFITKIDLEEEVRKGNVAAAILSAAALVGIAIIIAASIG